MLSGLARKISSLLQAPTKVREDSAASDDDTRRAEPLEAGTTGFLEGSDPDEVPAEQAAKPECLRTETLPLVQPQRARYDRMEPAPEGPTDDMSQTSEHADLIGDLEGKDKAVPLLLTEQVADSDAADEATVRILQALADEDGATVSADGPHKSPGRIQEEISSNSDRSEGSEDALPTPEPSRDLRASAENVPHPGANDAFDAVVTSEEEHLIAELARFTRDYEEAVDEHERAFRMGLVDEVIRRLDRSVGEERSRFIQDYVRRSAAAEEETPEAMVKERTIKALVADSECSVRLRNAIAGASNLPVGTVAEYMRAPEQSREAFKRIRNLGTKSIEELHELVTDAFSSEGVAEGKGELSEGAQAGRQVEEKFQRALAVAQRMIEGLQFPDDVLNQFPSARLKNCLVKAYADHSITFSKLLSSYEEVVRNLRWKGNFGTKSSKELDRLITDVIRSRLSAHRIGEAFASSIRDLLAGRWIGDESLRAVLSYEDVDILPPLKEQVSLEWGETVNEIVTNLLNYLAEREREVVKRRYALDGGEPETLEEISRDHDVTRERIRQIEAKALRKMRNKRIIEALSAALDSEDAIEVVFKNRRLVTEEQIASVFKALDPRLRLAIDICYTGLKGFLERESVKTESGWTLEQYLLELPEEPEVFAGSLRQRLVDAILGEALPIRISAIADKFPDISMEELKQELRSSFSAKIDGDELRAAPRLPTYVRYTLILRDAGHALHCKEIRALNHEIFGKDESIQQIGSILGGLDEALIVARGTYDLYENLKLSSDDLKTIRANAHDYLEAREEYVSVKVLFSELFQGSTEKFGADFDYYMLLGILQDDERFDVRRGLMVGLAKFSSSQGFLGLNEEIVSVLTESSRAMSLEEIAAALEGRRDTFLTSIATSLENSPQAVSVGRGHYDLTSRVFGDEQQQGRLRDCCCIALSSGPKTVLALVELISPILGDFPSRPLKGFLSGFDAFQVESDLVYLRQTPPEISRYLEVRDAALRELGDGADDIARVRDYLARKGVRDLADLDPTLTRGAGTAGTRKDEDELLDKLLGDFGI
ncbi:sigma factor-like helix-turn-helix DNA-binding protein [Aliigemmobacter aestuarii]|nr:sigma factor-like helix-turn-helix DNA-binding protein [Gemmobacter aestuarii]